MIFRLGWISSKEKSRFSLALSLKNLGSDSDQQ